MRCTEEGRIRHLHLGSGSLCIQGSIDLDKPTRLVHEYTEQMMAVLLFVDPQDVPDLHAMQLGLGAGSLTRFCTQKLGVRATVIEIDPEVVQACQRWFGLAGEHPLLRIVLADAATEIQQPQWWGMVDVLHVDVYDHDAARPVLDDAPFYAHCRRMLSPKGCMAVNVFGESSHVEGTIERIAHSFGNAALWKFPTTRYGNTVVLAQYTPTHPGGEDRASAIQARWGLPARRWLRALRRI